MISSSNLISFLYLAEYQSACMCQYRLQGMFEAIEFNVNLKGALTKGRRSSMFY